MARRAGTKLASPFMVVLLLPARSAEPPQSSGSTPARADSTAPEAARVAIGVPAGKLGRESVQPSGSRPAAIRASRAARSGFASRHASKVVVQAACASAPRRTTSRLWASTSSSTWKVASGSRPMTSLVARISAAPRAEPCEAPVSCAWGAGQAITVRSTTNEGRGSERAASSAALRAWTSSVYPVSLSRLPRQSTVTTCQP